MTREEEFWAAVKVIQKAFQDRILVFEDWGKKRVSGGLYINGTNAKSCSWYSRDAFDGREAGFYLEDHAKIKLIDPIEVITKERDEAKAALARVEKDLERTAKERADAHSKLEELNLKVIQAQSK